MFKWSKPSKEDSDIIEKNNSLYNKLGYILTENLFSQNTSFFFDWQCLNFKNENDLKLLNYLITKWPHSLINDSQLSYIFNDKVIDNEYFNESIDRYNQNKCKLKTNHLPIHLYTSLDFNYLYYSIYPCDNDFYSHYKNKSQYFIGQLEERSININIFRERLVLNQIKEEEEDNNDISLKKSKSLKKKEVDKFKLIPEDPNKLINNDIHIVTTFHPHQLIQKFYFDLNEKEEDIHSILNKLKEGKEDSYFSKLNYDDNRFYTIVITLLIKLVIKSTNFNNIGEYINTKSEEEGKTIKYLFPNTIYLLNVNGLIILLLIVTEDKIIPYAFYDIKQQQQRVEEDDDDEFETIYEEMKNEINNKILNNNINYFDKEGNLIKSIKPKTATMIKIDDDYEIIKTKHSSYFIFNILSYFCKYKTLPDVDQLKIFNSNDYYNNLRPTIDIIFNDYIKHSMRNLFENELIQ